MAKPKSSPKRPSKKERHVYVQLHGLANVADVADSGDQTRPNTPNIPIGPSFHFHVPAPALVAGEAWHLHILDDSCDTTESNGPVIHLHLPEGASSDETADA